MLWKRESDRGEYLRRSSDFVRESPNSRDPRVIWFTREMLDYIDYITGDATGVHPLGL